MKKTYKVLDRPDFKKAAMRKKEEINYHNLVLEIADELKEYAREQKAFVATFGCQANVRDGEIISGIMQEIGFQLTDNREEARVIIFNTCAIREMAESKIYGQLGWAKALKKKNPNIIVILCGCMAQEEKNIALIEEKFHQVDIIFGTHNIEELPNLLLDFIINKNKVISIRSEQGDIKEFALDYRQKLHSAFVNIMQGCDRFCSYCIVPYVRGQERSREKNEILKELTKLRDDGYVEVTLVGQNVNAYGKNLKVPVTFASLLKDTAKLGFARIRFITSNVYDFTDEMIDIIKTHPNIMPHIHLPLQSGDDQVLKAMNRQYSYLEYQTLYHKLRTAIPNISITTDIIVGFPNESAEAFEKTYQAAEQLQFDSAFTFIYSPRPGTPASRIQDNISLTEKKQRLYRLNNLIAESAKKRNALLLHLSLEVLVEGQEEKKDAIVYFGYSKELKLVHFTSAVPLTIGMLVMVKIQRAMAWTLHGTIDLEQSSLLNAQSINHLLHQDNAIKNAMNLKKLVESNSELSALKEKIITLKKDIVNAKDTKVQEELKKQKEELEKAFNMHPLIYNHRINLNESNQLFLQIEKILDFKS